MAATKKSTRSRSAAKKSSSSRRKTTSRKKSTGRKYSPKAGKSVEREMKAMKQGKLKSGRSGKKVTSRKQAIAIGLSEARQEGKKGPPQKKQELALFLAADDASGPPLCCEKIEGWLESRSLALDVRFAGKRHVLPVSYSVK